MELPVPQIIADLRTDFESQQPTFRVDDPGSEDVATALRAARDLIHSSGFVFVHTRTDNEDFNKVHDEDPDPTYMPPARMAAKWLPKPLELELTKWGPDVKSNNTKISFFIGDVYERFGRRMLRTGDLIEVPQRYLGGQRPRFYYIDNGSEEQFFRYVPLYFGCQVHLLEGDQHMRPPTATNDSCDGGLT